MPSHHVLYPFLGIHHFLTAASFGWPGKGADHDTCPIEATLVKRL